MPIEPEMGSLVEVCGWGGTECAGDGTVEENFRGPYPLGNKLIVSAPGCETRKSNTAYLYYVRQTTLLVTLRTQQTY